MFPFQFQNEKLRSALYIDLDWYLLPIEYQRDVGHMINRLKRGAVLTIGPFEVYSYEVARTVTQQIHSFLMLLINFGSMKE